MLCHASSMTNSKMPTKRQANVGELLLPMATPSSWMNKVDYSMDSDPSLACMRQLYKLYNCSGSAIRDIKVVREGSYNDC